MISVINLKLLRPSFKLFLKILTAIYLSIMNIFRIPKPSLLCLILSPVPALPPAEITAHTESSTSIMLSWNPVPPGHENGVVLGYKILYVDQDETQPKLNSTVEANVSSFEVTGLMTFTNYCIQVLAFTRKGDGNMSDCLITLTGEDGKRTSSFLFNLWRNIVALQVEQVVARIITACSTFHATNFSVVS